MDRFYEVMFIVRPDLAEEEVDKIIASLEQTVTNGGGTVRSTEKMGRRKLAYLVRKWQSWSAACALPSR
jgi:small subunit ribosomal protein S6